MNNKFIKYNISIFISFLKKLTNFLSVFSILFIVLATYFFSFKIPKIDMKINEIESKLSKLNFSQNTINQAQIAAHSDYNLGKALTELNPIMTKQKQSLISDVIDLTKEAMISAYQLKYGEIINEQKINELYPINKVPTDYDMDYLKKELDKLNDEPIFRDNKVKELEDQKDKKSDVLKWAIILQILGLVFMNIKFYYKEDSVGKLEQGSLASPEKESSGIAKVNESRQNAKVEAKDKILKLFESKAEIANDDVQKLLAVSDATATNYLDELEQEGIITQIGKEGRGVKYTRKNGSRGQSIFS